MSKSTKNSSSFHFLQIYRIQTGPQLQIFIWKTWNFWHPLKWKKIKMLLSLQKGYVNIYSIILMLFKNYNASNNFSGEIMLDRIWPPYFAAIWNFKIARIYSKVNAFRIMHSTILFLKANSQSRPDPSDSF